MLWNRIQATDYGCKRLVGQHSGWTQRADGSDVSASVLDTAWPSFLDCALRMWVLKGSVGLLAHTSCLSEYGVPHI